MEWTSPPALLISVVAAVLATAAAGSAAPLGLPGCPTSCANVTVPYPFGIGANCSLSTGFNLTCDHTYSPPRLFVQGVQVTDVSLDEATVRVLNEVIVTGGFNSTLDLSSFGMGFLSGGRHAARAQPRRDAPLITGCSSFCSLNSQRRGWGSLDGGGGCHECHGTGCCKAAIPSLYSTYIVHYGWVALIGDVDPGIQSFVTIAEKSWMQQAWCRMMIGGGKQLHEAPPPDLSMVPVLLEWAMDSTLGPSSSDSAATSRCPKDGASSACKSKHSSCNEVDKPFHRGYKCRCLPGYHGNPYLADGCQDIDECADPKHYGCYGECNNMLGTFECRCRRGFQGNASMVHGCVKSSQGLSIALGVGSGAMVLILALSTMIILQKLKKRRIMKQRQRFFKQNHGQLLQQLVCQRADIAERMIVTEEELETATNNFDKARKLGGGGHGTVYKGILSSQHVVAIKKSNIVIQKEITEFINEVAILSQVNHRNIVKLIGCCLETEVPLLVYEFISNGTLHNHLHVEHSISLSWKDRLRVAIETARALTYFHSLVSTPIIHRDIRSPNILLDDMLTVKLSDFGASMYIPIDEEVVHTDVQGTLGYLDPTYLITGHLTEKSDVYSFGVLLIELLTRKQPVSYRSCQGFNLVNHFVTLLSQGNLDEILDRQVAREG
ncbi:hypothetical protein PVAP13_8NG129700 [Panicum virgatum]|uniref:Protein kinase domain-containing protein n=1 Tax=Panicum virgatum TaxID=38727 RepID=A0A8T0PG09_PANVG|nr:hypothetical protein PVAP13_8NG129700 [Panicum virgatum]